ncbi:MULTISPECIES: hypothetical protein [unclassified Pseudomonas]|uniref:defense against restriction DarA-related protein n=1 Tax=unclassified Pseudomonas TaxID=196821 RepID=UPI000A1FFBAD|nr:MULTISPECIES: hypothetical protein [unclassified Pseudomonas]
MSDTYTQLASAAHSGAFGLGAKRTPTADQVRAGNYAKGSLRLHGLPITIETPMFTPRTGKEDGKPWSIVCMANYGYINGTKGADGDAFDVYVGPVPESTLVVVVNQVKKDGSFDEHKAVLGFHDVDTALTAYRNSYQKDWRGMGSYVVCTVRQFKAWLKAGEFSKPLTAGDLVPDLLKASGAAFVTWGENDLPVGVTVGDVIYDLRRLDQDKLMLDSATMADITEFLSDGSMLDAMVIEFAQFDRKANQLLRVMQAVAGEVKAESVEVSKPFKNRGTTQVAMLFSMSDGQSVSVFFHNPDSTPNKLAQTDELISWKWVLNKKDITVVVAPERGQDISPRQVARRIMALVQKNSAKFIKAAGASAEKTAQLEGLKAQAQEKLAEVDRLDAEIAELQAKVDALPKASAAPAEDGSSPPPAKDVSYAQRALAKADAAAERLKALGVTPMTREEFMAQVNSGESSGFSMDFLTARLKEYQDTLAGVRAGTVKPRSVVGKGGTKKAAIAWLETAIAEVQEALENGGITYPVNANNYEYHLSKQLRELEAQQTGGTENQDHGNGADDAEAQKIARLLEMLAAARAKLAGMAPGDAFYGNLATDIASMAKQLWDAGYRGPEAIQAAPEPLDRTAWEEAVTQALADTLRSSYGDAAGVMEANEAVVDGQFAAGATPEAAAQFIEKAARLEQPDMLGDDPSLRDNRSDLEKLTDALKAGDSLGALSLLQRFEDPAELRKLVTDAGFSLGASSTVDEILSGVGRDLVRAGRNKVDGFGLAAMDKAAHEAAQTAAVQAAEPSPTPSATDTDDTGDIAPEGRENTVKTAKGTKVVTGFRVIEAKNLIISHEADGTANPDYPGELQPRDRARATSQAWVQKTARSLDPDSLGRTNRADSGAPIVGPDRVVESGNGRAMAIREAYRIGQADEYREWLLEHADYFKVSAAKIEAMKAPVLVRVRVSDVNRAEFAVEANQDDKLAMTATEKARSDAKRLDSAMMAKLADGDLSSGANRAFVNAFLQSLGDAEAAQYLTSDGNPTASLISRVQAALFAGAYADDRLLELTADVSKPEIANIVSALNMAAPDFMRAKDLDQVGAETAGEQVADSLELSLDQEAVNAILDATNMLRKAKESGMGLEEFLRQGDMFGGVDPAVAAMAMFISKNNRSAKRLGTAFKAMAQFVETEAKRKQTAGLFGDEPARFVDIVKAANERLEKEFGEGVFAIEQNDLFNQAPPAQPATPAVVENEGEDNAVKEAKAYLDSVIEGTADMSVPDKVMKRLEEIYAAYGEGELSGLFADAAEAFAQQALKATAGDF